MDGFPTAVELLGMIKYACIWVLVVVGLCANSEAARRNYRKAGTLAI
jgi:hypothetical protein